MFPMMVVGMWTGVEWRVLQQPHVGRQGAPRKSWTPRITLGEQAAADTIHPEAV